MQNVVAGKRVKCDFEIDFSNRGGIQGHDFHLDIEGEDKNVRTLADLIVRDLRLTRADDVRILHKEIVREPHGRSAAKPSTVATREQGLLVDLSHTIEEGMITYKGLPAPLICDFMSREASKQLYAEGTTFQIGKIEMVANTGTYLDSPFHRFADGKDVAELDLSNLAGLDGVVVRLQCTAGTTVDRNAFSSVDVRGKAVLVHTGWAQHWRTDQYFEEHPFLTEAAAFYLKEQGAVLVGIDSLNIDDTSGGVRPVHTTLLGAGILIVEHLCNLEKLPISGFTFTSVPVKVKGMGTFPVRAFARLGGA